MLGATSDIKINLKCENLYFFKFKTSNENNYYIFTFVSIKIH